MSFNEYGDYALWIDYAAAESRPCHIHWDGVLVKTNAANGKTGGWEETYQRWQKQGAISGGPGIHLLRISRDREAIPHIRSIKLVSLNG